MHILKVALLSGVSIFIKVISAIITNKFISVYIGPSGLGIIAQFQNFSAMVQMISGAGITNGVVKYTADDSNKSVLWSTAITMTIVTSLLCSFLLIILSVPLAYLFLSDISLFYIFIVFGITLSFFSLNQLMLAILTGLKKTKTYIYINISQSIYSVFSTSMLIYFFELEGALIAMVTNQSLVFIGVAFYFRQSFIQNAKKMTFGINKEYRNKLIQYSVMTLTTTLCIPLSSLIIRSIVSQKLTWDYAGYWQAMTYISSMYFLIITTILSIHYFPRLASSKSINDIKREIIDTSLLIIPLTITIAIIIYILKDIMIKVLFTEEFSVITPLFKYQLLGDIIKVFSYMMSYIMIAKARVKPYIITEIFSAVTLVGFSLLGLYLFGFIGLSYGYFISNIIYFLVMLITTIIYIKSVNY